LEPIEIMKKSNKPNNLNSILMFSILTK